MISVQGETPAAVENKTEFETLLADFSARFINLPPAEVDREIESAQARICRCLGFDRSTLWQRPPDRPEAFLLTHAYQCLDVPQLPMRTDASDLCPWLLSEVQQGHTIAFSSLADFPPEGARDLETLTRHGTKANVVIPLSTGGTIIGALSFASLTHERDWPATLISRLELVAQVFSSALTRARHDQQLRASLAEVQRLRDQLKGQNVYLRREVRLLHRQHRLVSRSDAMQRVLMQVEQVAETGSTVLLLGETGTGKEVVALTLHDASPRRDHVMVRVNCSAIPASLIESELFGREKGAYTGALSKQVGRFEMASGSTLFLDEIGDLPPEVQVKLLRVLQERQIERLGSPKPIDVDVRIIAATNQDLEAAVREGRFRQDLYYRLNVFPVRVPPLRERREDIPSLVSAFVQEFGSAFGKNIESIDKDSMEALQAYDWPGNVRELRNVIERAMIVTNGPNLRIELPARTLPAHLPSLGLREVDREHIRRVLDMTNWRIRGRNGAAELLAIKPTTLESRIAKLGLRRPGNSYSNPAFGPEEDFGPKGRGAVLLRALGDNADRP